jgi:serine/threonine protein kinase
MTPKRFEKVRSLFEQTLERAPEQRAAFLQHACGEDDELRAEVERMLDADAQLESPIDVPALEAAGRLSAPDLYNLKGRRIGPYLIQEVIGSGGMGVVYRATRADPFHKDVAFKVVRPVPGNPEIVERFQQEREILASLEHPHIARLLDGGSTPEGIPYFVMEYVEGTPIHRYCDEHRLNVTERLRLFQSVCEAMQYAHQNLVVHRDLKPENILVSRDAEVKVLDFGIAKVLHSAEDGVTAYMTRQGLLVMTPEYASPEQIKGEPITTGSDVYTLGVVLYELLTGHRPYRLKSRVLHEISKAICDEQPTRPSSVVGETAEAAGRNQEPARITPEQVSRVREGKPEQLKRRLSGDLDHILLHALSKEPRRRYSSVEQFNEDLRRHLQGLPVAARRDTVRYRAGKFVRRHRVGVLAATTMLLVLVCGIVFTTWKAEVAWEEQQRAERRTQQVRSLALSMLDQIDERVRSLPNSLGVRGLLIDQATKALKTLGEPQEQPYGFRRYLTRRFTGAPSPPEVRRPNAWFAGGYAPELYEIGVDHSVFHSGGASGYIAAKKAEGGDWATLMQRIVAENYRGHRIRLSGFIRTQGVVEGAHLWVRADALGGVRAFDAMQKRPIRGTTDWRRYEIVLDIPDDSAGIFFGLLFIGARGKAWIDDLELEIVTNETPTTEKALQEREPEYATPRVPGRPGNLGFENGYQAAESAARRGAGGIFEGAGAGGILISPTR